MLSYISYSGLFSKGFYFRIFKETFFCEKYFLGASFLQKYITTINNIMLACTHVIQLSLHHEH